MNKPLAVMLFIGLFALPAFAWWDADWTHRTPINVSNAAGYLRNKEPITRGFVFDSGLVKNCTDDLRIAAVYSGGETEVPSWVFNTTYSGGWCVAATVGWIMNVTTTGANVTHVNNSGTNYYLYFNDTAANGAPSYGTALYNMFNDSSTVQLLWLNSWDGAATTLYDSSVNLYNVSGWAASAGAQTYGTTKWVLGANHTTTDDDAVNATTSIRSLYTNNMSVEVYSSQRLDTADRYFLWVGSNADWNVIFTARANESLTCQIVLGASAFVVNSSTAFLTGVPTHSVCTFDANLASNRLKIYTNGSVVGQLNAANASFRSGTASTNYFSATGTTDAAGISGMLEMMRFSNITRYPTDNSSGLSNTFLPMTQPMVVTNGSVETSFVNTPPEVSDVIIDPDLPFVGNELNCSAICTDVDADDLFANFTWYQNGVNVDTYDTQVACVNATICHTDTNVSELLVYEDNWSCSAICYDETDYSDDWLNSSNVTIDEVCNQVMNLTKTMDNSSFNNETTQNGCVVNLIITVHNASKAYAHDCSAGGTGDYWDDHDYCVINCSTTAQPACSYNPLLLNITDYLDNSTWPCDLYITRNEDIDDSMVAEQVWQYANRTLSSSDFAAEVWDYPVRNLSAIGMKQVDRQVEIVDPFEWLKKDYVCMAGGLLAGIGILALLAIWKVR